MGFAQTIWKHYEYEQGNFRISAADSMTYKVQEVEVPIGKITYHTYYYQDKDTADNVFYQVQYFDYPEGTVHADSLELIELVFDENIKSAEKAVLGEMVYQHPINLRGNPGRLFKIIFQDGKAAIKTKMIIAGNRYYAISVVGFRDKSLNPYVDDFLESFYYLGNEKL